MKRKVLLIAAAALLTPVAAAGLALATPGSGITSTVHVPRATLSEDVHVNADRVKFQTKDAVDVSVVTLRMAPGATTGWHSHPGLALIAVTQGTMTLYAPDCSSRTYASGASFVESGNVPMVGRNETAGDVVLTVTFVAPRGVASFRIDQPNPGCSVN